MSEIKTDKKNDYLFKIIITQFLCVAVIIGICIGVKCFFKGTYKELKVWYLSEVCDKTDINQVLEG